MFKENVIVDDHEWVDMAGARFESLFRMGVEDDATVLFRTTMSPGKYVPLHDHIDPESLYVARGKIEVFLIDEEPRWHDLRTDRSILLADGIKHALRNSSDEDAHILVGTNARLARYFRDAGRAVSPGQPHVKPTPEDIQRMVRVSAEYGYWMSTPAESLAVTG